MRWISLFLGLAYFFSELLLSITRRAPKSANMRESDHSSLRLLWIVIGLSIWLALWLTSHFRAALLPHLRFFLALAVAIFACGLVLRWWSIIRLGRFFTVNVAIARDHELIETGPYRYLRHPSYTGVLLAFLGFGLSLGNWAALLGLLLPIFIAFLYRMKVEERTLIEGLGEKYVSYCRRTKRLVPFLY
ncbi:MAG: isoprenylcysteine carboxylmethyltransferase family protein [Verrucomicrobiota bacterium]|nr:isoprenylcysteine carboxylmethyltransferase family protein [Verrucomicrobiota bacterium]